MVDFKKYQDNLPDTNEELLELAEKILKQKVLRNPNYLYEKTGFDTHSGTTFRPKCKINIIGCLVMNILGKDYSIREYYHIAFFEANLQRKLNNFNTYIHGFNKSSENTVKSGK